MKRNLSNSFIFLFCIITGCSNHFQEEKVEPRDPSLIDTSVEIAIRGSKIIMNGVNSFVWSRGDKVNVFAEEAQISGPFEASDKGRSVVFNGFKHKDDVLTAVLCPFDREATYEDGVIRTTIPSEQNGSMSNMLCVGTATDLDYFEVFPCSSMLKFYVPASSGTTSVRMTAIQPICGPVKISASKGTLTSTSTKGKTITVSGIDPVNAGTYYVSVLPSSVVTSLSIGFNGGEDSYIVSLDKGISEGINDIGELNYMFSFHPCLFLKKGEEAKIESRIEENADMMNLHKKILARAESYIAKVPSVYDISTGGVVEQLLYTCRASLNYLFSFSYAWRMTGEKKYLDAAVKELTAVCKFPDWCPIHYIDVAEMATGVAIGYDWLYDALDIETRELCEKALKEKSLDTYFDKANVTRWWYCVNNNRNQVCSAGLYLTGMVLKNLYPDKCATVMRDVAASVKYAVDGYNPDGNYMEGAGYWSYGTSFNAILNYAMETNGEIPYYGGNGFYQTPHYFLHMKGPSGEVFNYSDGGSECDLEIAPFYFAQWQKDVDLLWWELQSIRKNFTQTNRLLPVAMCFAKDLDLVQITPPTKLTWYGKGITPVYSTRLSWSDPNTSWFAIKGGYCNTSHAHMDGGSFVFETGGERWVIDLGGESYTKLENNGIAQGVLTQDSQRWDVQKYCPASHSGLRLDEARYNVAAQATILSTHDDALRQGVLMDLTPLYNFEKNGKAEIVANLVTRKASLMKDTGVLEIVDELLPNKSVKYTFTAPNDIKTSASIKDAQTIVLTKNGKSVQVHITASDPSLTFLPVSRAIKANNNYESANARAIDFNCQIPAGKTTIFTITFTLL